MTRPPFIPMMLATCAVALLSACGGSSGSTAPTFNSTTGTANITVIAAQAQTLSSAEGRINFQNNRIAAGVLNGNLNSARDSVSLAEGGTAALTDGANRYVRVFTADPFGVVRSTGVVGINPDTLPQATTTYTGTTALTVRDGTTVYDLEGRANLQADFAGDTVSLTLSRLNGTAAPAFAARTNVSNIATLTIEDAAISGTGFAGGTAALDSTVLNGGAALDASTITDMRGGFFGDKGQEAGGLFTLRDDSAQTFAIQGDFIVR